MDDRISLFEDSLRRSLKALQAMQDRNDPEMALMNAQFALQHLTEIAVCRYREPQDGIRFLLEANTVNLVRTVLGLVENGFAKFKQAPRSSTQLLAVKRASIFIAWLVGEIDAGIRLLTVVVDRDRRKQFGRSRIYDALEDSLYALVSGNAFAAPVLKGSGGDKLGIEHLNVVSDLIAGRDISHSLKLATTGFFRRQKDKRLDLAAYDGNANGPAAHWDFRLVAIGVYLATAKAPNFALQADALKRAAEL